MTSDATNYTQSLQEKFVENLKKRLDFDRYNKCRCKRCKRND